MRYWEDSPPNRDPFEDLEERLKKVRSSMPKPKPSGDLMSRLAGQIIGVIVIAAGLSVFLCFCVWLCFMMIRSVS